VRDPHQAGTSHVAVCIDNIPGEKIVVFPRLGSHCRFAEHGFSAVRA
jgi:hypothetical protein